MENKVCTTYDEREKIERTFGSMGLRSEKSIAQHILLENAYGNNLVPDISKVDYLADNKGGTHLQPLADLQVFVVVFQMRWLNSTLKNHIKF